MPGSRGIVLTQSTVSRTPPRRAIAHICKRVLLGLCMTGAYLTWDIFAVSSPDDRVLLKDVMNQLRGDHDFNLSIDGLRTRVDELTGFPFPLIFHGRLRGQQMLRG